MKIYCIAIFPPNTEEPSISASLYDSNNELKIDYKKFIIDQIKPLTNLAHGQAGLHKLPILADHFIYAKILKNNLTIIFITNHPVAPEPLKEMLKKMKEARSRSELKQIIKDADPEEQTKIEEIKEDLAETKEMMQINIQKILLRGEKLKEVEAKAEELHKATENFNKQATKLKKRYQCAGFFSFFGFVQSWVVNPILQKAGYEYTPAKKGPAP